MTRRFEVPSQLPLNEQSGSSFAALVELMQRLLAPDGCPWDREQTQESLKPYVLEEACEVMDAIDSGDPRQLCEELGDLALQIAFLSELSRNEGSFGPDDVMRAICDKLVRRHPHVFADTEVSDSDEVARNWEQIKAQEKRDRPLLDGIPRAYPALKRAQRLGDRASSVGFDWPDPAGTRVKVQEELSELDAAIASGDRGQIEAELGDILFALVNMARHYDVDAEQALQGTAQRFTNRFEYVERVVRERYGQWPQDARGKPTRGVALEEMDALWEEAKERE